MNQLQTQPQTAVNFLTPQSLQEAMQVANILADSDIVPKDYQRKPGNILVALQWGAEIGLQPLQALQNIACINGRPAIWGDAMLALVRQSGLLASIKEEQNDTQATCIVQRKGEEPHTSVFTMEDAKRAGLAGKSGPWTNYPKRMMQLRARAYALRDIFPDVLKGMAIAEEEQDKEIDVTPENTTTKAKANSGASALKARLKKTENVVDVQEPTVKIDVAPYHQKIQQATDLEQLKAIGDEIAKLNLGEPEKTDLRTAYSQRVEQLSQPKFDNVTLSELLDELENASDLVTLNTILAEKFEPFTSQMNELQIEQVTNVYERKVAELTD